MKFQLDTRKAKLIVCLLAVLALFLGAIICLSLWEEGSPGTAAEGEDQTGLEKVYYDGEWYRQKQGIETMLVLGVDKYTDFDGPVQGDYEQSDFLMLLIIDKQNESCAALHINRDTMVDYEMLKDNGQFAGTAHGQITLAHAYGGEPGMRCRNTMKSVSSLLYGTKIDHYMSLTMDGVMLLNDLIGGVTVEVMTDMTQVDPGFVKGEKVTLKGEKMLKYVRARKGVGDGSNVGRMERQAQYLEALQDKLTDSMLGSDFMDKALSEINPYMESDCSVEKLSEISDRLSEYGVSEYLDIAGEADDSGKFVEFNPDEAALQKLVMERFYEKAE